MLISLADLDPDLVLGLAGSGSAKKMDSDLDSQKICVADPVNFFWIRIRGSGFKQSDSDPDPT